MSGGEYPIARRIHAQRVGARRAALGCALAALAFGTRASPVDEGFHATGEAVVIRFATPDIVRIPSGNFVVGSGIEERLASRAMCLGETTMPVLVRVCVGDPGACSGAAMALETPLRTRWIHAFEIDRTEVTVGNYWRCVRSGACAEPSVRERDPQYGSPDQPVVGVSWYDARRYCHWTHGRLPSGDEWERAARGRDGRMFPWGEQVDRRRANHGALGLGCLDERDGAALSARVGSYPDGVSPDGLQDMAGNVSEWVEEPWEMFVNDPDGPPTTVVTGEKTWRGGSFRTPRFTGRCAYRGHSPADERRTDLGFRCAYDVHERG